jgi:hypothetical protein
LYLEYGILARIVIFNKAKNPSETFMGLNVTALNPPYAALLYQNHTVHVSGPSTNDIMTVLRYIENESGIQLVYTDRALVERLTDVLK